LGATSQLNAFGLDANTLHHVSFLFFKPLPTNTHTHTHIERHVSIYTQTLPFHPISELTSSIQKKTDVKMAYLYGTVKKHLLY